MGAGGSFTTGLGGDTIVAVKIIVYALTFAVILVIAGAIAALSLAVAPAIAKSNGWSVLAVILSGLAVAGGVVYLAEKLVNLWKGVGKMVLEVLTEKFKQHEREAGIKIGEERGLVRGREEGLAEGRAEGREEGRGLGRAEGLAEGRGLGRAEGREEGRGLGLAEGREEGRGLGRAEGRAEGRGLGRAEGRAEGQEAKNREVRAWYERQQAALRAGIPFDEPPPVYFADTHTNGAEGG